MNLTPIIDAIASCDVSAPAKEQAGVLVQGWMEQFADDAEKLQIVAVEQPWYLWLNFTTLAVGVRDLVTKVGYGEWKTKKEPQRRKDGEYYKGQGPDVWAQELGSSIQLAAYAMQNEGATFLVRAAVKSNPPEYWEAEVAIPAERAALARYSFLNAADQIRALRYRSAPWRFPGHQVYGRECVCAAPFNEEGAVSKLGSTDPGAKAIELALTEYPERDTSELVVLSASGYEAFVTCPEAYRRSLFVGGEETNEALDTGTAFHAGLAAWYKILKEEQI